VIESLTPSEQVITILYRELVGIVGESAPLNIDPNRQNFIMLVGLQGNGKTTTAAKIAKFLKGKGYKPLLIPLDFKRPAAYEQLVDLGERNGLPVFKDSSGEPVSVIKDALSYMGEQGFNIGIVDTAGRKEIDTDLMDELKIVHEVLKPQETLLVMDSTIGQGALRVCQGFLDFVDLTGGIFTKFDSSAKGGSVLSFRYVTGKPVKFIGVGEKIDDLETFEPERLISRILGRGDELKIVHEVLKPQETLLVMDSTIGQGALRVCQGFLDFVDLTGGIFTKFDSSAKGGSVLSFRYVTGKPVKFIGVGEKIDDLETFEPERLISRILGRGDIQTLVERAQKAISEEESVKLLKKVSEGSFDLNDFREELQSLAKMGGISSIASYLPFASQMKLPANFSDDKMTRKMVAIINSMTKEECENPDIINGSRRKRIAKGAGVEKYDVNLLLKNYFNFKKLIKNVKSIDQIIKFR
jgi:signal recognition particle GTPase